jgi:hypothetical protein
MNPFVLGIQANLKRAYGQFTEDILEACAKQSEFRSIVFALCFFHAALLERKKFGVGNLPGATSGLLLFSPPFRVQKCALISLTCARRCLCALLLLCFFLYCAAEAQEVRHRQPQVSHCNTGQHSSLSRSA